MKKREPNSKLSNSNKNKSRQNNTVIDNKSKFTPEQYTDSITLNDKITCIENLAKEVTQYYVDHPEALTLEAFCNFKRIPRETIFSWRKKYQVLDKAFNTVKSILTERRENLMLTKQIDSKAAMFSMPRYDSTWNIEDGWKELFKFHASLKADDQVSAKGNVFVNVPWLNNDKDKE